MLRQLCHRHTRRCLTDNLSIQSSQHLIQRHYHSHHVCPPIPSQTHTQSFPSIQNSGRHFTSIANTGCFSNSPPIDSHSYVPSIKSVVFSRSFSTSSSNTNHPTSQSPPSTPLPSNTQSSNHSHETCPQSQTDDLAGRSTPSPASSSPSSSATTVNEPQQPSLTSPSGRINPSSASIGNDPDATLAGSFHPSSSDPNVTQLAGRSEIPTSLSFPSSSTLSPSTTSSTVGSSASLSTSTLPTITENDIADFLRKVSKDEKLLKYAVGKGMTPKNKKRWIQALIQQLELDLIDGSPINDGTVSPAVTLASTANSAAAALQQQESSPNSSIATSVVADVVQSSSLSSIPKDHKEKADQVFRILDVNQDGFVGLREFRIWFSTYYLNRRLAKEQSGRIKTPTAGEVARPVSTKLQSDSSITAEETREISGDISAAKDPSTRKEQNIKSLETFNPSTSETAALEALGMHKVEPPSSPSDGVSPLKQDFRSESVRQNEERTSTTNNESKFSDGSDVVTPATTAIVSESSLSDEAVDTDDVDDEEEDVEWKTLAQVILRSSIPYLAFGIIDNGLMLTCGEWIDSTVAVRFCLSTMAAAGLGNTLSCATGVVTGGFIERMCLRSRLVSQHSPILTPKQSLSIGVRNAHIVGSVLGIIFGCLIGMFPLLFVHKPPRATSDDA